MFLAFHCRNTDISKAVLLLCIIAINAGILAIYLTSIVVLFKNTSFAHPIGSIFQSYMILL